MGAQSKFWRVRFEEVNGASSLCSVAELSFYDGAVKLTGTLSASSFYGTGNEASQAGDGSLTTLWRSAAAQHVNSWLAVEFSADQYPTKVAISCTTETTEAPKKIWVEVSHNEGKAWSTVFGISHIDDWFSQQTKEFNIPLKGLNQLSRSFRGATRYRIRNLNTNSVGVEAFNVRKVKMAEYNGGPDILLGRAGATGTTMVGSANPEYTINGYDQTDGNNTGEYAPATMNFFLEYSFIEPKSVRELKIRNSSQGAGFMPRMLELEYSYHGAVWHPQAIIALAAGAIYQQQTFSSLPEVGYSAPHKYWRVRVAYAREDGSDSPVRIAKVEMSQRYQGANACSGGRAMASYGVAEDAFSGLGYWESAESEFGEWVGYKFPTAQVVQEVRITAETAAYAPYRILVEFSDNGLQWCDADMELECGAWTDGETKTFLFWDAYPADEMPSQHWAIMMPTINRSNLNSTGGWDYTAVGALKQLSFKDGNGDVVLPVDIYDVAGRYGATEYMYDSIGKLAYLTGVEKRNYQGRDCFFFAGGSHPDSDSNSNNAAGIMYSDSPDFQFGTGDFTVEFECCYGTQYVSYPRIITFGSYNQTIQGFMIFIHTTAHKMAFQLSKSGGGGPIHYVDSAYIDNQWHHYAFVRSGNTLKSYVDGVLQTTTMDLTGYSFQNSTCRVGRNCGYGADSATGEPLLGGLRNLRVTKGQALYTSAFTPPTEISGAPIPVSDPPPTDPNWDKVTMFCKFDGADGATNFTDSVGGGTITPMGTAHITTEFPQSGTGSVLLGGGANYLRSTVKPLAGVGTGDFTVEFWYSCVTYAVEATGPGQMSFDFGTWDFMMWNGRKVYVNAVLVSSVDVDTTGSWSHIAIVRQSGATSIFINGSKVGYSSSTFLGTDLSQTEDTLIGARNNGAHTSPVAQWKIDGLRVTNGVARYTADFTVTPYLEAPERLSEGAYDPYYSSVKFLPRMDRPDGSTSFLDDKGKVFTNPSSLVVADSTVKKFGVSSARFDGAAAYLTVPWSSDFDFGSGDFTVEAWIYPQANEAMLIQGIIGVRDSGSNHSWCLYLTKNADAIAFEANDLAIAATYGGVTPNVWQHIALSRVGNTFYVFTSGVLRGTVDATGVTLKTLVTTPAIGRASLALSNGFFKGYIDEIRVTKGVGRYSRNFTVPQAAFAGEAVGSGTIPGDPEWGKVVCAVRFDGAEGGTNLIDMKGNSFVPSGGVATLATSAKFGAAGGHFNGVDSKWRAPYSTSLKFGTGDFTIEAWVRTSQPRDPGLYVNGFIGMAGGWGFGPRLHDGKLAAFIYTGSYSQYVSSKVVDDGEWHHVAFTRASGELRLLCDGVVVGHWSGVTLDIAPYTSGTESYGLSLGFVWGNSKFFNGDVDDLRITVGLARYTGDYDVPTATFPDVDKVAGVGQALMVKGTEYLVTQAQSLIHPLQQSIIYNGAKKEFMWGTRGTSIANLRRQDGSSRWAGKYDGNIDLFAGTRFWSPASPDFDFGTGEFTIECLWKPNYHRNTDTNAELMGVDRGATSAPDAVTGEWLLRSSNVTDNRISFYYYTGSVWASISGATTNPTVVPDSVIANQDRWMHLAVTRRAGVIFLYINGYYIASVGYAGQIGVASKKVVFGSSHTDRQATVLSYASQGSLAEIRITKGVARYYPAISASERKKSGPQPKEGADPYWSSVTLCTEDLASPIADLKGHPHCLAAVHVNSPYLFAHGPMGSSLYFPNSQGLNMGISADWNLMEGDFTVEFLVNLTSVNTNDSVLLIQNSGLNSDYPWRIGVDKSYGKLSFITCSPTNTLNPACSTPGVFPLGTWVAVCVERQGTTNRIYLDGVKVQELVQSPTIITTNGKPLTIGSRWTNYDSEAMIGYMSNIRITKGVARYKGTNYTPATEPFPTDIGGDPNWNYVVLSMPCNGTLSGNSIPSTDLLGYSLSDNLGAALRPGGTSGQGMYFDGTNKGVQLPATVDYEFDGDDFTIELDFCPYSLTGVDSLLSCRTITDKSVSGTWGLGLEVGRFMLYNYSNGLVWGYANPAVSILTWYSLVLQKKNGVLVLLLNGNVAMGIQDARHIIFQKGSALHIGANPQVPTTESFNGWISNVRITKGVARYSVPVMPTERFKTVEDAYWANTSLLIHADQAPNGHWMRQGSVYDEKGKPIIFAEPNQARSWVCGREVYADFGKPVQLSAVDCTMPSSSSLESHPSIIQLARLRRKGYAWDRVATITPVGLSNGQKVAMPVKPNDFNDLPEKHRYWRLAIPTPSRAAVIVEMAAFLPDADSVPLATGRDVWSQCGNGVPYSVVKPDNNSYWVPLYPYFSSGVASYSDAPWATLDLGVATQPKYLVVKLGWHTHKDYASWDNRFPRGAIIEFSDDKTTWSPFAEVVFPTTGRMDNFYGVFDLSERVELSNSLVQNLDGKIINEEYPAFDGEATDGTMSYVMPQAMTRFPQGHLRRAMMSAAVLPGSKHGRISGVVTTKGFAASRRVLLLDYKSMMVMDSIWSDEDGSYSFDGLDPDVEYLVLSQDYARQYNAVVQDAIIPEIL